MTEKENSKPADLDKAAALKFRERLKGIYPDVNPENDEQWEELSQKYFDEREGQLSQYKETEKTLNELIASDDDLANVLNDMMLSHYSFKEAVAKYLSAEDLIPQEGEPDYEKMTQAHAARVERAKKRKSQMDELEKNEAASFEAIDKFCAEKKMDDAAKEKFIQQINDFFDILVMKKIDQKALESLYKAVSFDDAVAKAEEAGEVRGRNANIDAMKVKAEEREKGDGIPALGGSGGEPTEKRVKGNSMFSGIKPERRF